MKKWNGIFLPVILASFLLSGCEDPNIGAIIVGNTSVGGQTMFTSVQLTFTLQTEDSTQLVAVSTDLDGPEGSGSPTIPSIALDPNSVYEMTVDILDETGGGNPRNLTSQFLAPNHQIFFEGDILTFVDHQYFDEDNRGLPVGFRNLMTTHSQALGPIIVTVKDQTNIKDENTDVDDGATIVQGRFTLVVN